MRYRPAQLVCAYLLGLSVASCQIQLSRRFASKIVFVSMYVEEIVFAKQSRGIDPGRSAAGPAKTAQDIQNWKTKRTPVTASSLWGSLARLLVVLVIIGSEDGGGKGFVYRTLPWQEASKETTLDFTNEMQ
ncbi:uncharacterized protein FOBCDRAFT_198366 [Fusarium oxysporum Fo47]|uniref:uncharacterized protein n=1 Tax=Fusarium oxysporum Fo47 TaxID=660027 RepID=UPI00286999AF|nr:uncharacterized protein FOBCDRAFT_198366 [Fusarium oxysporum Fo47]WJG34949.1 hypothetical protein FOBCDRAFT_198366 [Fusarium oxysporum Fo47]